MATSGDEKESDKQERKPAPKDVRETKVERTTSLAGIRHRARATKGDGVTFGESLREYRKPDEEKNLVNTTQTNTSIYRYDADHKNIYEKGAPYDNIGPLNDRVTSLASFISSSYSLDWKESEKLAHIANSAIERTVAEHRAGKPLSLEPTFTPAAEGADAQASTLTLPDAPPKYPYAPRMAGGIVKYLEDNWARYIEAGILTRPDLKRIDPPAYAALWNWLRNPKHQLPDGWTIPTRSEAIDEYVHRAGLLDGQAHREARRLAEAAKRRITRKPQ